MNERDLEAAQGVDPLTDIASLQRENIEMRRSLEAANARTRSLEYQLHRIQNMLAVIRSIHRRTRESSADPEEAADHFAGRLDAIARYQCHEAGGSRSIIEVEDIVRDELHEVRCGDGPDCTIGGPSVILKSQAAELMGLAVHELTTNSVKFGVLSRRRGTLSVQWSIERSAGGRSLRFRWIESGVATLASAPRRSGFGRQLIEQAMPYQLGAGTSFVLRPGGLECEILLPLRDEDNNQEGL